MPHVPCLWLGAMWAKPAKVGVSFVLDVFNRVFDVSDQIGFRRLGGILSGLPHSVFGEPSVRVRGDFPGGDLARSDEFLGEPTAGLTAMLALKAVEDIVRLRCLDALNQRHVSP